MGKNKYQKPAAEETKVTAPEGAPEQPTEVTEPADEQQSETTVSEETPEETVEGTESNDANGTEQNDAPEKTPAEEPPVAPVVTTPAPKPAVTLTDSAAKRFDGVSKVARVALQIFDDYAKTMSNPVSAQVIDVQQKRLHSTLMSVIRYPEASDFIAAMDGLLRIVRENRDTAFHETKVFRGMSSVSLSADARKQLEYIVTVLLAMTSGEQAKEAVKRVDMRLVTETFKNGAQADRFVAYFRKKTGN